MSLHKAQRPVLLLGAGVRLAGAEKEVRELVEVLQIPVVLTWGAVDLLPESCIYRIGTFGTHGTRAANFTVQNADYVLSIGCRLDTKATGTPAKWFARAAHIVMVDIDQAEIDKMQHVGVKVEGVCMDAKRYINDRLPADKEYRRLDTADVGEPYNPWLDKCRDWKARYPAVLPEYEQETGVNPYVLVRELSWLAEPGDVIVSDTGCALAWGMQAWEFKEGQRWLHPMNQTPMGYGLPGAIGAHYATGKRVICLTGDGSIMMSIAELTTIGQKKLPIKIVLLNNSGHSMCAQTEREWFGGKHHATSPASGLTFPDFIALAEASGIESELFCDVVTPPLDTFMGDEPYFLEIQINHDHDVVPKARFGAANEDQYPALPREVLAAEMLIPEAA